MGPDGTLVCARIDATAFTYPHLAVATSGFPRSEFLLELRDLGNATIATGVEVTIGSGTVQEVTWNPPGGLAYDVLLHIEHADPAVVSGFTFVDFQLTMAR